MSDVSDEGITKVSKLDFGDPLYLHPSDITGSSFISFKLIGT